MKGKTEHSQYVSNDMSQMNDYVIHYTAVLSY